MRGTAIIVLYIAFFVSLFVPIYTYILYPIILRLLPPQKNITDDDFKPFVSVLITANRSEKLTSEKAVNIQALQYPSERIEVLICRSGVSDDNAELKIVNDTVYNRVEAINALLNAASGTVLVITDHETPIDPESIDYLTRHFIDKRVGGVVGQLQNVSPSAFWKYENYVRINEGKIGCVSGANKAIYAIRSEIIERIPAFTISEDFYISTMVRQKGYDVIFEEKAIAFENHRERANHVKDGANYYQALSIFWKMLFPRRGWFVFWSHRVMKLLVPFNLIVLFVSNGLLAFESKWMFGAFLLQILGYAVLFLYDIAFVRKDKHIISILDKPLSLGVYFISLNLAWLSGLFQFIINKGRFTDK